MSEHEKKPWTIDRKRTQFWWEECIIRDSEGSAVGSVYTWAPDDIDVPALFATAREMLEALKGLVEPVEILGVPATLGDVEYAREVIDRAEGKA